MNVQIPHFQKTSNTKETIAVYCLSVTDLYNVNTTTGLKTFYTNRTVNKSKRHGLSSKQCNEPHVLLVARTK